MSVRLANFFRLADVRQTLYREVCFTQTYSLAQMKTLPDLPKFCLVCLAGPALNAPAIYNHSHYGAGNSGDIDFSLCKAWVYARHCGDSLMVKALLKTRRLNMDFRNDPTFSDRQVLANSADTDQTVVCSESTLFAILSASF